MNSSNSFRSPRLSVGLPVYNAEKYLAESLDAILAQTFQDFELIISDNASTDATAEICKEYLQRDSRIRYHRNPKNLGVAANYNGTVHLAQAEFFRWATYDDLIGPEHFEKCIEVLESNPEVVLCYPKTINIDEDGNVLGNYEDGLCILDDQPHVRFRKAMKRLVFCDCNAEYGIIRREVLLKTGMEADYHSADRVLLAELVLHGAFYEVPYRLQYHRLHKAASTQVNKSARDWSAWLNPSTAGKRSYPKVRRFIEFFRAINRGPVRGYKKVYCYVQVLLFYVHPDKWKRLVRRLGNPQKLRVPLGNSHERTRHVSSE
jgi:glycosyltransferase involved in cell wall biosynthesis